MMVKGIPLVGLAVLLAGSCPAGGQQSSVPKPENPALREEILRREKTDQETRQAGIAWMRKQPTAATVKPGDKAPLEVERVRQVDADNLAWLKKTIAKVGWPGIRMVGKDGAHSVWLLIQHCDSNHAFQKKCLKLMEAAVKKNDADKQDVALLTDRVLVAEGKKQIYGTQAKIADGDATPYPIEYEANLDKRRAGVGLPPMAEYMKMLKEMYLGKKADR